jgi:hypothetical protein
MPAERGTQLQSQSLCKGIANADGRQVGQVAYLCWDVELPYNSYLMQLKQMGVPEALLTVPDASVVWNSELHKASCSAVCNSRVQDCEVIRFAVCVRYVCVGAPVVTCNAHACCQHREFPRACERGKCPPPPPNSAGQGRISRHTEADRRRVNPQAHVSAAVWCRA